MSTIPAAVAIDEVMATVLDGGPSPCETHPMSRHAHVVAFRGEHLQTVGRALVRWPRTPYTANGHVAETVLVVVSNHRVLLYGRRHAMASCFSYWWQVDTGGVAWQGPGGACLSYRVERPQVSSGRRVRALRVDLPRSVERVDGSTLRDALTFEWVEGIDVVTGEPRRRSAPRLARALQEAYDDRIVVPVERLARLMPRPPDAVCVGCGGELEAHWLVCPRCGTSIAAAPLGS